MSRYPLKLPEQLKHDAAAWADQQGVSLNQFIVWAVSEKVGGLKQQLHDPDFPGVEYRTGASGWPTPVLRGTGLRVQVLAVARWNGNMSDEEIADEWGIGVERTREALAFAESHRVEIESALDTDAALERGVP